MIPTSLVYIGDTVPINTRQRTLTDLMAATAVGTALATVGGGLAAYLEAWRVAFAVPALAAGALAAGALALWLSLLPEPTAAAGQPRDPGALGKIWQVIHRPWVVLVIVIAMVEGAVILGFLTFLAPALEAGGYSPAVAGLAVGLYGVAVLGWSRLVKRLAGRLVAGSLILCGGLMLALGYAVGSFGQTLAGIWVAAALVGGGFAFMHSTLQTWATEVTPEARATTISLFASAVVAGSAASTTMAAPLADDGSFGLLFASAALISVPLGLVGSFARRRYSARC